ncbi:SLBB domain-containing protein [Marinomonas aquiplantarum]|uniref:Protein involved in polysaccharide export with SLBB domain n=1 Tax=Marinomonas aquiplantarum TaxID=491951 RepID=A0A366D6S3_9GAMM|nr:SLBB domain-containing protein [Marinomonas aquiplantarum]RBO85751.1 protein involved in polysaccharide export with SLBB domain [Marinomonas aquiplantarum]
MYLKRLLTAALCTVMTTSVLAFTPTAAQISQFQSLPKAQQEALAKQYGIDLNAIDVSSGVQESATQQAPMVQSTMKAASEEVGGEDETQNKADAKILKKFGYDVLKGDAQGFTVVDNLPVPLDYQMGPGDSVSVQTFGKTSASYELTIDRDGRLNIPDLGPISAAGQTFAQLSDQISRVFKQKVIGVDVSIAMGSMRTMQVYIVGEVQQPGSFNVNALTTITQALVATGGVKETGSLRHIQLKRKGKVVREFDLYELLLKGDTANDVRLSAGDTLFVPTLRSTIELAGEVQRPAIYELKNTTSLDQLLEISGGATPQAYLSKVSVRRATAEGVKQFTVDLTKAQGRRFEVRGGDQVQLFKASSSLRGAVAVRGDVIRQGAMAYQKGMRISDVIGSIDDDLKPSADLTYALLVREYNQDKDIEVYQFNLSNALQYQDSRDNLLLQERDQIFVFSNGLDMAYWDSYTKPREKVSSHSDLSDKEYVDTETGALIQQVSTTELDTAQVDDISSLARNRQANREALLQPIIERLLEQASLGAPAALVEISGAVKFPGTYPLAKNGDLPSLIAAAGGLTEEAYLRSAELTRREKVSNYGRTVNQQIGFSLQDALSGKYPIALRAQDNIMIRTQPGYQKDLVVELQGEVVFPGKYSFQRGETLKDVIERAGGFTSFAYPEGAVLSRERLKRQEKERIDFLTAQLKQEISAMSLRRENTSASTPEQALAIVNQLDQAEPVGRLVIDVKQAMTGNKQANVLLEKGDKLFIPALNPVVSVVGEVQFASHHTYDSNLAVDDYLEAAGGLKRQADSERVYVIKANGSVELPNNSFWFSRHDKALAPGDTIIVPINTDYMDSLSTLSTATQILYQLGVAWSAVKD